MAALEGRSAPGLRFLALLCALILAVAADCQREQKREGWLSGLYARGRRVFFETVRETILNHPLKTALSETELRKTMSLEDAFPRVYGILMNVYYLKEAPQFQALLENIGPESRLAFGQKYLELARFAGRNLAESLLDEGPHADFIRRIQPRFKGKDRVDLILLSMGYFARLDIPEVKTFANPLNPEFDRQWGLDAGKFREAHRLTQGEGARVAVLDSGIDASHSIFKHTDLGPHFVLVGRDREPWSEGGAPMVDWGWHGTVVSSIVARYAPAARITLYRAMDADTMNDAPFPRILGHFMAACIYRAVHDGNNVINISAGMGTDIDYVREACRFAYENNVIIVTASPYYLGKYMGNNDNFPGAYPTTISVTGIDRRSDGTYGYWDAAAPEFTTTVGAPCAPFVAYPTYVEEKDDYAPGISCATPIVTAALALAVSRYPRTGNERPGEYFETLKKLLTETANPKACGFSGFSPECGYGLVDAESLVKAADRLQARRSPIRTP
jgi:hypothetical protein